MRWARDLGGGYGRGRNGRGISPGPSPPTRARERETPARRTLSGGMEARILAAALEPRKGGLPPRAECLPPPRQRGKTPPEFRHRADITRGTATWRVGAGGTAPPARMGAPAGAPP